MQSLLDHSRWEPSLAPDHDLLARGVEVAHTGLVAGVRDHEAQNRAFADAVLGPVDLGGHAEHLVGAGHRTGRRHLGGRRARGRTAAGCRRAAAPPTSWRGRRRCSAAWWTERCPGRWAPEGVPRRDGSPAPGCDGVRTAAPGGTARTPEPGAGKPAGERSVRRGWRGWWCHRRGGGGGLGTEHRDQGPDEQEEHRDRRRDRHRASLPVDGRGQRTHWIPHVTESIGTITTSCGVAHRAARRHEREVPDRWTTVRRACPRRPTEVDS